MEGQNMMQASSLTQKKKTQHLYAPSNFDI